MMESFPDETVKVAEAIDSSAEMHSSGRNIFDVGVERVKRKSESLFRRVERNSNFHLRRLVRIL